MFLPTAHPERQVDHATGMWSLPVSIISADRETQARVALDRKWIAHLAEQLRTDVSMTPLLVYFDGQSYWLADGHHRLEAAKQCGRDRVAVDLRGGTKTDAIFAGIEANAQNRRYFTTADKRRAVETFLHDASRQRWPDNRIAKACGVDPHTVARRKLDLGISQVEVVEVVRSDGRTYALPTRNIGRGGDLGQLRRALKFVMGAVVKRALGVHLTPLLTHVSIGDGQMYAYCGSRAQGCPVDLEINCTPKAEQLSRALEHCREGVALRLADDGRLVVESGDFTARVDCSAESLPMVMPEGEVIYELPPGLLGTLERIAPFIAEDASRKWARGVLFTGGYAYATNNIILARHEWAGPPLGINIPAMTVEELLRIGEEPSRLQIDEKSATFHWPDGRWLRTTLASTVGWPSVDSMVDAPATPQQLPEGFFKALRTLAPLAREERRVYLRGDRLEAGGASVSLPGLPERRCFHIEQLLKLEGVATSIDWDSGIFVGERVRGVIVAMTGEDVERPPAMPPAPAMPVPKPSLLPDWQVQRLAGLVRQLRVAEVDGHVEITADEKQLGLLIEEFTNLELLRIPRDSLAMLRRELPVLLGALASR